MRADSKQTLLEDQSYFSFLSTGFIKELHKNNQETCFLGKSRRHQVHVIEILA